MPLTTNQICTNTARNDDIRDRPHSALNGRGIGGLLDCVTRKTSFIRIKAEFRM